MQVQQVKYLFLRGEPAYQMFDLNKKATCVVNAVAFAAPSGRAGDIYLREKRLVEDLGVGTRRIDVVGYVRPWGDVFRTEDIPRTHRETIFLPAQGWMDGVWYDGPLFHLDDSGALINVVAEGLPFTLDVNGMRPANDPCDLTTFHEQRAASRLTSLVQAMRLALRAPVDRALLVDIANFGLRDILDTVVVRKAYPDHPIYLRHALPYKKWPSGFKRLCQNINIPLYDAEEPPEGVVVPRNLWSEQMRGQERFLLDGSSIVPKTFLRDTE